jgi:molecular chaperone Hsp33
MLKEGERVSLEFSGDGPLKNILVDATPEGTVRGFVTRPRTHLPARDGKLDVGGAVGRGVLCVMRVPPEGTAYRSVVPLASGEIGIDVARYLLDSEQTPSAVGVGVFVEPDGRVGAAGGYVVQTMPGAERDTAEQLEQNVARAGAPSDLVRQGLDGASMLSRLLAGFGISRPEERPVAFRCRCSRDRVAAAILAMGRAEILDVFANERRVEAVCEFCSERYVVEEEELRALLASVGNGA